MHLTMKWTKNNLRSVSVIKGDCLSNKALTLVALLHIFFYRDALRQVFDLLSEKTSFGLRIMKFHNFAHLMKHYRPRMRKLLAN